MRDILDAVADGEMTPAQAEAELRGYATGEAGRFDAARETRGGVPEAVYARGKTPAEVAGLVSTAVETTGRGIATRTTPDQVEEVRRRVGVDHPEADVRYDERSDVLVVSRADFDRPSVDATVCVVTAGTADAVPAGEAAAIAREMGVTVERVDDVGVASLVRVVDQLGDLRDADVLIVAAGREGALPTVVAGLVDVPVIALPVSSGYGFGGDGEAALSGMLQSCTVLSVVNVDAGFVAGAQAGLIARTVGAARDSGR